MDQNTLKICVVTPDKARKKTLLKTKADKEKNKVKR